MQLVGETQLTAVAGVFLNVNMVCEPVANPVPDTVTFVPPATGPVAGLTPVTCGLFVLEAIVTAGGVRTVFGRHGHVHGCGRVRWSDGNDRSR